jgi:hypothetical protein
MLVEIVEQESLKKEKKEIVNSATEENRIADRLLLTPQSAGVSLVLVALLSAEIIKKVN